VYSHVGENQRIAVLGDAYFTFAPDRSVNNLEFVCGWAFQAYHYVWVTEPVTFMPVDLRPIAQSPASLCFNRPPCFELVADHRPTRALAILGKRYYVRGYGGILYKNTRCPVK
jgi:hypothetical protein